MRVDFYQLSGDPIETVVPLLAAKAVEGGGRLLVVSADPDRRAALSQALGEREDAFLAHGEAGDAYAARQPVLLAESCDAANGARMVFPMGCGAPRRRTSSALCCCSRPTRPARRGNYRPLSAEVHALRIFKQRDDGGWREGR